MWTKSRSVMMAVIGVALGLGVGVPASAAPSTGTATPGWRLAEPFGRCGRGEVLSVTAKGPLNAWASGYYPPSCQGTAPLLAHWNGRSWRRLALPARFTTYLSNGATTVATFSGSQAWTFAGVGQQSYALLWKNNRWRTYALADNSDVSSAVVFSQTNAWAFGSIGASAYAGRFNGRTWRRVAIPVAPQSTADPAPDNIWAVGPLAKDVNQPFPRPFALAHWTGRWRTIPFPPLRLPSGAGIDYAWVVSDSGAGAFVAVGTSSQPGWVLLRWTGTSWVRIKTTVSADLIGPIARDGHGGLWIASVSPKPQCWSGGLYCDDVDMLHRSAAGTWRTTVIKVANLDLTDMRLIPGTSSIWASGSIPAGHNGFIPVILKYGR